MELEADDIKSDKSVKKWKQCPPSAKHHKSKFVLTSRKIWSQPRGPQSSEFQIPGRDVHTGWCTDSRHHHLPSWWEIMHFSHNPRWREWMNVHLDDETLAYQAGHTLDIVLVGCDESIGISILVQPLWSLTTLVSDSRRTTRRSSVN